MNILEMRQYTYLRYYGFVKKSKVLTWSVILLLSLLCLPVIHYITTLEPVIKVSDYVSTVKHVPVITLEDRTKTIIKENNKTIDDDTASDLADAIVEVAKSDVSRIKLLLSLAKVESGFKQYAISETGALSFFQILPRWHIDKIKKLEVADLYDAHNQTILANQVISDCSKKFKKLDATLKCYNGNSDPNYADKVIHNMNSINL